MLTRAELDELKRYERKAAGKITAKIKVISKVRSKKKKLKVATTSKVSKKSSRSKRPKKKRGAQPPSKKARPPVDEAEVRRLGLECENRAEADAAIRTRRSLAEIFKKYPQLRQAWDRGRFLRSLRGLARTAISVSDAAKKLGFANGQVLRAMIDEDEEVGELWNETRLEVKIEFNAALFDEAKGGNPAAIKAVQQNLLLDEKERPGSDFSRITILQLAELTGKTRQTIHDWHTKFGLPRNADKTFDLSIFLSWHKKFLYKNTSGLTIFQLTEITGKSRQTINEWHTKCGLSRNADKTFDLDVFIAWFEEFLLKKASMEKKTMAMLDPLRAAKAEKLKVELEKCRKELLNRQEVVVSWVQWIENLKTYCNRGAEQFAVLYQNQPREKVKELMHAWFRKMYLSFTKLPQSFELPPAMEKELIDFLQRLNPQANIEDVTQ